MISEIFSEIDEVNSKDLENLIRKVIEYNPRYSSNIIDILTKIKEHNYAKEFVDFLLEIVDEGYRIEIIDMDYNLKGILHIFDATASLDIKIKLLPAVGNDLFQDFTTDILLENPRDENRYLMMMTALRLIISDHYYVNIINPRDMYEDEFSSQYSERFI